MIKVNTEDSLINPIEVKNEFNVIKQEIRKAIGRKRKFCKVLDYAGCINSGAGITFSCDGKYYMIKKPKMLSTNKAVEKKELKGLPEPKIYNDQYGFPTYYWFTSDRNEFFQILFKVLKGIMMFNAKHRVKAREYNKAIQSNDLDRAYRLKNELM